MKRMLLISTLVVACAPYPTGKASKVTVEGYALLVQEDPKRPGNWGVTIDEAGQPFRFGYDPLTRRRVSVSAIERTSGCAVRQETVVLSDPGQGVYAEVRC